MSTNSTARISPSLRTLLLQVTGATDLADSDVVQTLWSGYGQLLRCHLRGGRHQSVIVKHVRWPSTQDHPRGWNSNISHERKVHSYKVETHWYQQYASDCNAMCRVPHCLAVTNLGDEVFIILEDLDPAGFAGRRTSVNDAELKACLSWLANFHATFMGRSAQGLWEVGTYWHLATRPDELAVLEDGPLKAQAAEIDRQLTSTAFVTLVHGDAKLANFCFSRDGQKVAAVDFQYVGGGCGMKDVAYFISSCLDEHDSEQQEQALLDFYFAELQASLIASQSTIDFGALQQDWRALYPVAWTDFYRFLQGWSPGHWKIHRYSARLAREVLAALAIAP